MYRLVTVLVAMATCVRAQYETYDYNLTEVDSLGDNHTLICDYEGRLVNDTATLWIVPDLRNFNETDYEERIQVSADKKQITVIEVDQSDFGTYFCVLETGEMQRVGLNLKGPYYEDLGEKYEQNIILAFAAMLSFLFAALYIWLVVKFRYVPENTSRVGSLPVMKSKGLALSTIEVASKALEQQARSDSRQANGSITGTATEHDVTQPNGTAATEGVENAAYDDDADGRRISESPV